LENLEKIIKKGLTDGKTFSKDSRRIGGNWYEILGFSLNPFEKELHNIPKFGDTLIYDTSKIRNLSTLVGGASYAENFHHVVIVGPAGSGKSTLLSVLYDNAKKNGFNVDYLDFFGEKDSTMDLHNIDNTNIACLFCDNYSVQDLTKIANIRKRYPGLLITAIQTGQYYISSKPNLNIDRSIFLSRSSKIEISENLKKRVALVGDNLRLQLPKKFYKYVAELSINNWGLANDIANEWGEVLFSDVSILSSSSDSVGEGFDGFYEVYSEWAGYTQEKVDKYKLKLDNLTSKEMELLTVIVNRSVSNSKEFSPDDLMSDISGSKSLIYRYLQRLADNKLIYVREKGRRKFFSISRPRKIIIENNLQEKIMRM